jgi:hypothetical protein
VRGVSVARDTSDGTGECMEQTPYEVLGIAPTATLKEAHAAWRRLCAIYHPDRYQNASRDVRAEAELRMTQVNAAYTAINAEQTRGARFSSPTSSHTATGSTPQQPASSTQTTTHVAPPGTRTVAAPRRGVAVAAGIGTVMVLLGVFALPWAEVTLAGGGRSTASAGQVRDALGKASGTQGWIVRNGGVLLVVVLAFAAMILIHGFAIQPLRRPPDRQAYQSALVVFALGASWAGDVIYLINQRLTAASTALASSGATAKVGAGAWVTLLGALTLAGTAWPFAMTPTP